MSEQAYLRPTATQKIRTFFNDVGEPVPPWTGFDEVMDHMFAVLYARRDDDAFWKSAETLIESLRSGHLGGKANGLPDPKAEILPGDKIDAIVAELQAAVQRSRQRPGKGVMKKFVQGLSAPLMGCVLMMGAAFATGCDKGESDAAAKLNQYVDDSSISAVDKDALKACFNGWTDTQKQSLVDLFSSQSPEQIATALEAMLDPGGQCYSAPADAEEAADVPAEDVRNEDAQPVDVQPEDVQQEEAQPDIPNEPMPDAIYKGVTF